MDQSAKFLDDVRAMSRALREPPPFGPAGTVYLVTAYVRSSVFVRIHGDSVLCAADLPFTRTGCDVLARDVSRARTFLEATLPTLLMLDRGALAAAGLPAFLFTALDEAVASNDLQAAVIAHDALVHVLERGL